MRFWLVLNLLSPLSLLSAEIIDVNLYAHFFNSMLLLFLLKAVVYFINLFEEAILYIINHNNKKKTVRYRVTWF